MPAEKTEKLIKVKLLRAHWIGEERINPPAELEVSLEEALRSLKPGLLLAPMF